MIPVRFEQQNALYGPPPDLSESQCLTIAAFKGTVERGPVEGAEIVVVAWKPSPQDIEAMQSGSPIFLSMLGGLTPHFLSMSFESAIAPA